MYPTSKAVYNHVCKYHLMNSWIMESQNGQEANNAGFLCSWGNGCDQIKRQKWSLVNHLMVIHELKAN